MAEPLRIIFTQSLMTGEVPEDWKAANVTPIYKKDSKQDLLNYRPISLTSVPCKLLEKIVRNHIHKYLECNNLSKDQHGFWANRSCLTQLLEELDEKDDIDVVYLDCRKAFKTVPHRRLLLKLESLGIRDQTLKWIESFLTNRKQRVVVKGAHSN